MKATPIQPGLSLEGVPITLEQASRVFEMQRHIVVQLDGGKWVCEVSSVRINKDGCTAKLTVIGPLKGD